MFAPLLLLSPGKKSRVVRVLAIFNSIKLIEPKEVPNSRDTGGVPY